MAEGIRPIRRAERKPKEPAVDTSTPFHTYTRSGDDTLEQPYEKPVVVPAQHDQSVSRHAWADARFATDVMSEHALFFALLMPVELAATERRQALEFCDTFGELTRRITDAGPPEPGDTADFCADVVEAIKPFIEYKATLGAAQRDGTLRSLVWPLFFDHTRHEAERWSRRLTQLGGGDSEFERDEVVPFWSDIMAEHCYFVAHLLDPRRPSSSRRRSPPGRSSRSSTAVSPTPSGRSPSIRRR